MKCLLIAVFLSTLSLSLAAPPDAAAGTDAKKSASKKEAAAKDKPVIQLGMTPEEVMKVIGRPDSVENVDTPAGKGEQWLYRRLANEWTTQTAATVETVPSFVGLAMPNDGLGEATLPSNRLEKVKVFQVSSLLFIEGKLAAAKQWPEKERRIDN